MEAGGVIEMAVGEHYIANLLPLAVAARKSQTTGINGNAIVYYDRQ